MTTAQAPQAQTNKDRLKKIGLGLLGCGTVGSGLVQLSEHYPELEIIKVVVRDASKKRDLNLDQSIYTEDAAEVIENPNVDIVVEVRGGVAETKELLLKALANGKNIVTANKDLVAQEGEALFEAAKQAGKVIQYEAAVAGGIPIIATLKQSLTSNRIHKLFGIINGTTNYMLDAMEREGVDFETILKRAQDLGFAEADPSSDVDGFDAAYKTAILASIISGKRVDFSKVYVEGIRNISLADIKSAAKRGYRIKLLGMVDNAEDSIGVRVHPAMVPLDNSLASVAKENNAILVYGDAIQELTLIGKGAGSLPTASSVLADVLNLSAQLQYTTEPNPMQVCQHTEYATVKDITEAVSSFYVRLVMFDKVGVLKDLGLITEKHGANVKFIDQYEAHDAEALLDCIIDPLPEASMNKVLADLKQLDSIKEVQSVIRVID